MERMYGVFEYDIVIEGNPKCEHSLYVEKIRYQFKIIFLFDWLQI